MALYQIDIEKALGTETWTNVYHVEAANDAAANTAGQAIVAAERACHWSGITFTALRLRLAGAGHTGQVVTLNVLGQVATTAAKLPLFCVARVDFANGMPRPARKYLRFGADINAVVNTGQWSSGVLTMFGTYVSSILAIAAMRDPKGRTLSAGAVRADIAMHQLRRGNRHKPII